MFTRADLRQHFQSVNGREPTPQELDELEHHAAPTTVAISAGNDAGRQYDHQAGLARVYQDALKAGLPDEGARAAVAIAQTEGGMGGAEGDKDMGGSAGTFQLFFGGGQGNGFAKAMGLSESVAKDLLKRDPHVANEWALTGYLGGAIKQGLAKGLTGPALATYAQQHGQVSVSPERAGQNYTALFKGAGTQQFLEANAPAESTTVTPQADDERLDVTSRPRREWSITPAEQPQAVPGMSTTRGEIPETPEQKKLREYLSGLQGLDAFSRHLAQQIEGVDTSLPKYVLPGLPKIDLGWRSSRYALPGLR